MRITILDPNSLKRLSASAEHFTISTVTHAGETTYHVTLVGTAASTEMDSFDEKTSLTRSFTTLPEIDIRA